MSMNLITLYSLTELSSPTLAELGSQFEGLGEHVTFRVPNGGSRVWIGMIWGLCAEGSGVVFEDLFFLVIMMIFIVQIGAKFRIQ